MSTNYEFVQEAFRSYTWRTARKRTCSKWLGVVAGVGWATDATQEIL